LVAGERKIVAEEDRPKKRVAGEESKGEKRSEKREKGSCEWPREE